MNAHVKKKSTRGKAYVPGRLQNLHIQGIKYNIENALYYET